MVRWRSLCLPAAVAICLFTTGVASAQEKSKYDQLIEGKTRLDGMWTMFFSDQKLLVELSNDALKRDYIIIPSISKGISRGNVLGGMSWGFGDDVIWGFQQSGDKLFVLQRNVRFRARPKSPEASAVELAYSDSILYSLPIQTKSPKGNILVDMTGVFLNDDLEIGNEIGPGFRFAADRSTFAKVKAFSENVELQLNSVYSGNLRLDTVPNSKGVQVGVHYSVSVLPPVGANGYKPRKADDRVGYFLTAVKDFSELDEPEHFVRYINRWNLQKLDPAIDLSPPKEPIKFYIENTVPVFLRPTVEAGILEWNKAFEKLGFAGAMKVDQQPADPNFDPENIHYNTFRWMTAEAGFAMGPSRVDPRTGQILDADIIFDASFLDSWNRRWETFRSEDVAALTPNWSPLDEKLLASGATTIPHRHSAGCSYCLEMQRQTGFAAAVFLANGVSATGALPKEFIHEGLKEVVMHEVGHTLGLRHNFKASAWKSLEQINNPETGRAEGTVASVMDYAPPNISADPKNQGLYYSQTIGPYDHWAIEYGYKLISGDENAELKKIASRAGEPALEYGTDEDTRSIDPDPYSNRFDLGQDPLEFVRRQVELTTGLMPGVVDRATKEGEGYQKARQAFNLLFGEYRRALGFAARFPGGISVGRDHKGDKDGKAPFQVVDAAKQRDAMKLIAESAFAPPQIEGTSLNYLAVSRWSHWGTSDPIRVDYPIHDDVLAMQDGILGQLLNSMTLTRIADNEFKVPSDQDAYTLAEHLQTIVDSVFSEWKAKPEGEVTNRKPMITSFRRNLQRQAVRRLCASVTHGSGSPFDAQTLIRMHLGTLRDQAKALLVGDAKLDDYSRAHLADCVTRIEQALNAGVSLPSVN